MVLEGDKICLYDEKVANVGKEACRSRNWKTFWEENSGRQFGKCCVYGCGDDADVGAHVYVNTKKTSEQYYYITPMCHVHTTDPNLRHGQGWSMVKNDTVVVAVKIHSCEANGY